jgi:hypothetical protein
VGSERYLKTSFKIHKLILGSRIWNPGLVLNRNTPFWSRMAGLSGGQKMVSLVHRAPIIVELEQTILMAEISWNVSIGEDLLGDLSSIGVISYSHKIFDSIPRICRNVASKLAPSLHARHDPRLTAWNENRVALTGALK